MVLHPSRMSIKEQGANSVKWNFVQNLLLQGFSVVTTIILTRFLVPEDFGLIAIITVFISIGQAIIDGGLTASLIRDNQVNHEDYSTVFFANMGISLLLYGLIFLLAPIVSEFYENEKLTIILRILSINLLLSGFSGVQEKYLIKELEFKKLTIAKLPGTIIGSSFGIAAAIYGYGLWSLVIRELLTRSIDTLSLWLRSNWKPVFLFSVTKFRHHFKFGYKLLLTSILNTLFTEIYTLVIGKLFSISTLGYYNRANKYNQLPKKTILNVITNTTYPLLSKIQDDRSKVAEIYRKLILGLFFVLAPIFMLLGVIAEPLFALLLTEKWLPIVPFFQVIVFGSMIHPVLQLNNNVFKVFGRTDLTLKLAVYSKILVLISLAIGITFGVMPMLWASVISFYVSFFLRSYFNSKLIKYSTWHQVKDILPTFLTAIGIYVLGIFGLDLLSDNRSLVQVFILAMVLIAIYIFVNLLLRNHGVKAFLDLAIPVIKSIKSKKAKNGSTDA